MTQLGDKLRGFLGIETAAERDMWDRRLEFVRTTVEANYFSKDFQLELKAEEDLLRSAVDYTTISYNGVRIVAEERVRVKALCFARCALPVEGIDGSELRDLGFDLGKKYRGYGLLRIVGFPDGWEMTPSFTETGLTNTSHARVTDENGERQLDVFYRHADNTYKGYTHLA